MSEATTDNLRCALLTPAGVGAIAVVRVTGAAAWTLVRSMVRTQQGQLPEHPIAHRLYYGVFHDGGETLDDVIVAPHGANSGRTVDISCHGGVRVVERIVMALTECGAAWSEEPQAASGTSCWRESLRDMAYMLVSEATTRRGALFLIEQATALPSRLAELLQLWHSDKREEAQPALTALLNRSRGTEHLYCGADVAIVGPPNAGKSLLANRLAGRDGAIVADRAGTTRDWVHMETALDGIPISLIDTAGVRTTEDIIEASAIHAGSRRSASADLFLLVFDASAPAPPDASPWSRLPESTTIVVWNKVDIGQESVGGSCPKNVKWAQTVQTSALSGEGVDKLIEAITAVLIPECASGQATGPAVFCPRLRSTLVEASQSGELNEPILTGGIDASWKFHRRRRLERIPSRTGI